MKKSLRLMTLLAVWPLATLAQTGFEGEVENELDQLSGPPIQVQTVQAAPLPQSRAAMQPSTPNMGGQPIYILNQAPNTSGQFPGQFQASGQVQKQPTTYVEATPLSDSQADRMRKARQEAELTTETKIVEKLESSRMDDERRRAQILFGERFEKLNSKAQEQNQESSAPARSQIAPVDEPLVPAAAAPVVSAPSPVVVTPAPAPVPQYIPVQIVPMAQPQESVTEEAPENTRDIIREELQSAMKVEEDVPEQPIVDRYFGAILGSGEYQDVKNVDWNYSFGFTFGTKYDDTYALEGTFLFSNYTIRAAGSYPLSGGYAYGTGYGTGGPYGGSGYSPYSLQLGAYNDDVNQYSGSLAMKYFLFSGMVRPVVGGLVEYSYRKHTAMDYYNRPISTPEKLEITSHAIDLGGIVGAEITFSRRVSLGLDLRYLFNLSSRINSSNATFSSGSLTEKLNHYLYTITARANF